MLESRNKKKQYRGEISKLLSQAIDAIWGKCTKLHSK